MAQAITTEACAPTLARGDGWSDLLPYARAASGIGVLLYLEGVSLVETLFHQEWNLRAIVSGVADEVPALMIAVLSGAVIVAPVWLARRLMRGRS